MEESKLPTMFAPAERAPKDEVLSQFGAFQECQFTKVIDPLPSIVVILNQHRQVIYGNRSLQELLGLSSLEPILGFRPGEVFHCIHSSESEGGCGTTEFCRECGAVKTIVSSISGKPDVRECHMLRHVNGSIDALDLLTAAFPLELGGEKFNVFSVIDISHEKRRSALERIFFHDILNLAGGLKGLVEMLMEEIPENFKEDADLIHNAFQQLVEEIISQKELLAAERDELMPSFITLKSYDVLNVVSEQYKKHEVAKDRDIAVQSGIPDVDFESDFTLLSRVLGNMLKNALEASKPGETVTIGCEPEDDSVTFWAHNKAFMPRDIQLQIFNRSFTTKGKGRGIGTYSIKLLAERYLSGKVSFTSTESDGTKFFVTLPIKQP